MITKYCIILRYSSKGEYLMKKSYKRLICIVMSLFMLLSALPLTAPLTVHAANTWDPANGVYNISTEADLFAFRDSLDAGEDYDGIEINLLNDIEISQGTTYVSPCANRDEGLYVFCGTFNGNNHTISNLNMVSSDDSTVSFLPILYNGTIKDLTLKDVTIENGTTWNAAFVSISYGNDKIINCHLEGNCLIQADKNFTGGSNYTAGFVASNYRAGLEVRDCTVGEDVQIIGTTDAANYGYVGGILAFARKASTSILISGCENRAYVESVYVGSGIAGYVDTDNGYSYSVTITDCINYGTIYSPEISNGAKYFAGILAKDFKWTTVIVDRCVNHGDITVHGISSTGSGGVVGEVTNCAIQNSYNTGTITATSQNNIIGGIAGQLRTAQIENIVYAGGSQTYYNPETFNSIVNCYNTGNVSGANTDYVGGICGIIQDTSSTMDHSIIENAYNFGTISGGKKVGNACAEIQTTYVTNTFSPSGTACIETDSGYSNSISHIGYFTSADTNGIIYPATMTTGADESVSDEPMSGNLLQTLNQWVSDKNAELEADNNDYRYLTWKMTNPASEDGSKGVTVHPMFGTNEIIIRFFANFAANEEPFRTYTAADLVEGKVLAFYDLPAHDGYIFKGWYLDSENSDDDSPISYQTVYTQSTDIYAHWITVENVAKDEKDDNELPDGETEYGGFDLAGVQVREGIRDTNFDGRRKPGGLRFVTSLSMDVVNEINKIKADNIEYGYVAATHEGWIEYHKAGNRKLLYVSDSDTPPNGIYTASDKAENENYFGFANNINCTSEKSNTQGIVKEDHRNFEDYLLYTLVITYENCDEADLAKNVLARPYIRYTDANGLERVAYSEYRGNSNTLGGCYTSYNAVNANQGG